MPRITQQIMIMIFFCSGVPAAAGREGRGRGECWGRMDPGVGNCSPSCSLWWALSGTSGARRALAVLGREGHPCSCFCPGLAELS